MGRTLKLEKNKDGNSHQFIVNIPEHFRDNSWSDTIGKFQKEIDGLTTDEYIIFNFKLCRWIDPLPLLSLLIEIVRAKKRKVNVEAPFIFQWTLLEKTLANAYDFSKNHATLNIARDTPY